MTKNDETQLRSDLGVSRDAGGLVTLARGGMAVTFPDWEALRVAKTILIMAGYSAESENGELKEILCHPGALRVARDPDPELERLRRANISLGKRIGVLARERRRLAQLAAPGGGE